MAVHDNDVAVDFTVRVPAGVRFVGRTVNGSVTARSLQGDVDGRTVNGRIEIGTSGIASATTVNGAIDVAVGTPVWTEPLEFSTVNGSITREGAAGDRRAGQGRDDERRLLVGSSARRPDRPATAAGGSRGVIGNGGRELSLRTVNGSIHLEAAR